MPPVTWFETRLSSAPCSRRCRLYVQTVTVTSHGPRPPVRSADRIETLGFVSASNAGQFPAGVVKKTPGMILKKADQRWQRLTPLTRAQLFANRVDQLFAILSLPVSDAFTKRALRHWIAFRCAALSVHHVQRRAHHLHRPARGAQVVLP